MATSLGKVGIVDRGNYLQEETYNAGDFVLYNGSTWLALKDGLLGAEPAEGTSWKYLARGFEAEVLSMIAANDTSGLMGEEGQQVNAQSLIDVIADKVANRLIDKGLIANNLVTDNTEMVLAAPMGKVLKEQLDEQNNNINGVEIMKHLPFNNMGALNAFNIDEQAGNWISGFANENMEGTFPHTGWQNVIQFDTSHFRSQLSFDTNPLNSKDLYLRNKWANDTDWQSWNKIITNSDFKSTLVGLAYDNNIWNRHEVSFRKSYNTVQVTFIIDPKNDIGTLTKFATIGDTSFAPKMNTFIILTDRINNDSPVCCYIETNGTIRTTDAQGLKANHLYYGSVTYLVK